MPNPKFSIYEYLKKRPLSYSAFNSFCDPDWGNPEKWYETYILGKRQSSPELIFGSKIDRRIQDDLTFLPFLPRYTHMQLKMNVVIGKNIPLIGIPDGVNINPVKVLADFKTGVQKWDQKRADKSKQLTWYLLLLWMSRKLKPEDFTCRIHWLPTKKIENGNFDTIIDLDGDKFHTFETKRTMVDLLELIAEIKKVVKEMEEYVRNHE